MESLYNIATTAAREAIMEELQLQSRETHNAFYLWLIRLRHEHRIYFLNSDMAANQLWTDLRRDEALLDLIIRGSIGFYLRMSTVENTQSLYAQYCKALAESIGKLSGADNNKSKVTDELFSEKLPSGAELTKLLGSEQWLCFVLTLERELTKLVPAAMLEPLTPPVSKTGRN